MRPFSMFIAVVVVLIVIIGAAAAAMQPAAPSKTTTTGLGAGDSGQVSSTQGLALEAVLNSSAYTPGQTVSLTIGELNTLASENLVHAANDWAVQNLGVGPCGRLDLPFGFQVYLGYHAAGQSLNESQALALYPPDVAYNCPAILGGIDSYSFYPLSDFATATGSCSPEPCFGRNMTQTSGFAGYWAGASFRSFSPGVYTVVVGDEWGALLAVYFTVEPQGSAGTVLLPAGTSLTVSSSYDCIASHYSLEFNTSVPSTLSGGFAARSPGVTLYVATVQQAGSTSEGHPSTWLFSTGQNTSTSFSVPLSGGEYVVWIEGADLNCGAQVTIPLEELTQVNVTQSFTLAGTPTLQVL